VGSTVSSSSIGTGRHPGAAMPAAGSPPPDKCVKLMGQTQHGAMYAHTRIAAIAFLASLVVFQLACAAPPRVEAHAAPSDSPPNVIFDTDIWSDIDDMLALAMLHALHDRHEVNLVAVTISTDDPWCASYVDLVNTFYGHPQIPVGIVHDGMTIERFRKKFPDVTWPVTRYTEIISQRKRRDGSPVYPHRLTDGRKAPDAVSLLRKTLAGQPDGSVVMIQVGYSTNLARLLDSQGNAASPLDGRDLVRKKVRLLSVMAGNYRETQAEGKTYPEGQPEFNLMVDVPAAQKLFSSWPTPIVDSGFEIGLAMLYPGRSIQHDYSYAGSHPIADTYRTYCEEKKTKDPKIKRCPDDHDHATFDLTSVLYAARPDGNYFSVSKPGRITVLADGGSRFVESEDGNHRYLILSEEQKARTLEAMQMLASQPPRKQ
jgi:purine nucleosidase